MSQPTLNEALSAITTESDILNYLINYLDEDYKNIIQLTPLLPSLYTKFTNTSLFVTLIKKTLLEQDRSHIYPLIIQHNNLYTALSFDLVVSDHYQHRLALAELILQKGVCFDDKKIIEKLLDDEICLVVKQSLKCVCSDIFTENEIDVIIRRFIDHESYIVAGSVPNLLIHLKDVNRCDKYVKKFIKIQSWVARYNLCKNINLINFDKSNEEEIYRYFVNDEIKEIRYLFCSLIKNISNTKLQYTFYKEMLYDKDDSIKLCCVTEIGEKIKNTIEIYKIKYFFYILKKIIDDSNLEIKVKICEIFAENMSKVINNLNSSDIELLAFFDSELKKENDMFNIDTDANLTIINMFNLKEDYNFLNSLLENLVVNKRWRIREKVISILQNLINIDYKQFITEIKLFHANLLNDQVNDVRYKALNLLIQFIKIYGEKCIIDYKKELIEMAKNDKFVIRNLCLNFLQKINDLNIYFENEAVEIIVEIATILSNDSVEDVRNNLIIILKDYKNQYFYANSI
ncbi:hypothetical protein COBT_003317, partial [Conglomerata obtusa]